MKLSKRIALIFASLLMVLCVSVSVSAKESPTKQSFKASLKQSAVVYDGKTHKPSVVVKDLNGKTLNKKYYTVQAKKVKNAGTYTVTIKGKGKYAGYVQKLTYKIKLKKQKVSVSKSNITVRYNRNRATSQVVKVTKKTGRVTYKTNSSGIKVNKYGKITVAKGTRKGVYRITVTVRAKNYRTVKKSIRVTVK